MTFKLPDLPYDAGALEPHISRTTMETHHGKHHAAYIKNMNAILAERADAPKALEDVVQLAVREGNRKLRRRGITASSGNRLRPKHKVVPPAI